MESQASFEGRFVLLVALAFAALPPRAAGAGKRGFNVAGTFVEGCNCQIVCHCNVIGAMRGCHAIEAMAIHAGSYGGVNLAGAKFVVANAADEWARLYVDSSSAVVRQAVTDLVKALYGSDTKFEEVKSVRIELAGTGGRYMLSVDGGKIIELRTEPVLGADGRLPVGHTNTRTPFSPTVYQGRTVAGAIHDGARAFRLAGGNSFFNPHTERSGQI